MMKPWLAQRLIDRRDSRALSYHGQSFDYAEAAAEVQRRAATLAERGIERGSRVGLRAPNSLEWVWCAHAVLWLGATLVPLHPRASGEELAFQCSALPLDLLLVDEPVDPSVDATTATMPLEEARGPEGAQCRPADVDLDDVMTVMFTSGTTGTPKAVPLTLQNHLASATASAMRLGLCEDDHWLCCLPLCHVGGLAIVLRSAIYGTSFELLDEFDAPRVLDVLSSRPVTLSSFVPTMVHRLLETASDEIDSSLRAVLVGGGPIDADLLREARRRGIPGLPTYGMTEAGSQLATLSPHAVQVDSDEDGSDEAGDRLDTAGRPLEGVELRVQSDEGTTCATGESGAIWARGPMITRGYLGGPEANAERFRDGWFRTGDVGYLDDAGVLHVEHRKSELIVSGGENVDPTEVERVLLRAEPVADVAVVGVDDPEWGEAVAAMLVPKEGIQTDEADRLFESLAAHCREHLAKFKVPRRWRIVEAIPRTASGKIRRSQARRQMNDDAPQATSTHGACESPRNQSTQEPSENAYVSR